MTQPSSANDQDFSPKLLSVWREPPSPLPRALLLTLLLLCLGLLLWAFFGRLDIVARAEGTLVPRNRVQIVQPFEGGRVAEILVSEGQRVVAGQVLMRMDSQISNVETAALAEELGRVQLQLRRVTAELQGEALQQKPEDNPVVFAQIQEQLASNQAAYLTALEEQRAALNRTEAELAGAREVQQKLEDILPIFEDSEATYASLAAAGSVANWEALDRRRQRMETERDWVQQRLQIVSLEGQREEINARLDRLRTEYRQNLLAERDTLQERAASLEAERETRLYRNQLLALTAPREGVVKNLATHTEGYVVPSGTRLMTITPTGEPLQAEVYIQNQDVGFVRPGQVARLKLTAFPFQRFGTVEGQVALVSPDSNRNEDGPSGAPAGQPMQSAYQAILTPARQSLEKDGERLELRSGMAVVAEIKLGERSVMEYLLSPIRRTLDYAGKER
ncbi:MAG: HlyD family type I secretion periplasmic adaptor subunit [Saccharospirillum sp.]